MSTRGCVSVGQLVERVATAQVSDVRAHPYTISARCGPFGPPRFRGGLQLVQKSDFPRGGCSGLPLRLAKPVHTVTGVAWLAIALRVLRFRPLAALSGHIARCPHV